MRDVVPRVYVLIFAVAFAAHALWRWQQPDLSAQRRHLPLAPSIAALRVMSLGEPEVTAKLLMLWLQSFDTQPGLSLPLQALNYDTLIAWLERISRLDPRSRYPVFSAAYIYANVDQPDRQRQIFEFIADRFVAHPQRFWMGLAHASIMAKHRLGDPALARRYARLLRSHTQADQIPAWARQMEITILEEQGEYESARLLIGGLLADRLLTDAREREYLNRRLRQLRQKP